MGSAGVSAEDQTEARRLEKPLSVIRAANITTSFEALDVDQRGAKAVSADFS